MGEEVILGHFILCKSFCFRNFLLLLELKWYYITETMFVLAKAWPKWLKLDVLYGLFLGHLNFKQIGFGIYSFFFFGSMENSDSLKRRLCFIWAHVSYQRYLTLLYLLYFWCLTVQGLYPYIVNLENWKGKKKKE